MLKHQKKAIDNSIELLGQAHVELFSQISENRTGETPELLGLCQELMIKAGSIVESSEGESCSIVHDMEAYCEYIYLISLNLTTTRESIFYLNKACDSFKKITDWLKRVAVKKEVVFFPYSAAMWDSLESIWIAAGKDPEVEAYVIPIPYYEIDNQGQILTEKYDGEKLPPYVPITDYRSYKLAERMPDIAYIHNPFDRFNNVTSVHPDYYSNELKKYVTKVVYVPYFITYDAVFVTHRELPSYYYVDNIVVQCEKMMDSFAPAINRNKFLPFGSPIADRVINLDRNKPDIPEHWKPMLPNGKDFGGKKVVMYNTSLSMMLKERENFLDKIENILDIFREFEDIIPVWRPHPLMHSTLQSMGDSYYRRFQEIEKRFLAERIGVLDQTPDVGIAVALCDAYVGEYASSVIHMFGIAGKPRFYINLQTYKKPEPKKECKVTAFGTCTEKDTEYFVAEEYRYICKKDKASGEAELLAQIPGTKRYPYCAYRDICKCGDNIYLQPYSGEGICIYNIREASFQKIYVQDSVAYGFRRMLQVENSLYFLPGEYPYTVRFDMDTEEIEYYTSGNIPIREVADAISEVNDEPVGFKYQLPSKAVRQLKACEFVERTGGYPVYESEENRLQDFLYSVVAEGLYDKEKVRRSYQTVIETLDGSCGEKIHKVMMNSLVKEE